MKKAFYSILIIFALTSVIACNRSITSYVNPFVGTDGHGHTFPGAIVPFGMVQPGPDTRLSGWDGCSAYHYSDDTIYGFSHTHLSGTGCEDYGDILVMPFTDSASTQRKNYRSHFAHKNERAEPGYYSVILDKSRVLAELTATERTAVHRYTFPHNGVKGIVVDLCHRDKTLDCGMNLDRKTGILTGWRHSSAWNPNQRIFFALKANVPITHIEYVPADKDSVEGEHRHAKAIIYFPENTKEAELHVAISAVDQDGALKNLATDKGVSFKQARANPKDVWTRELSKVNVEGSSREDRRNFYTALYHCMTSPYLYSDVDGRYRGMDDTIHSTDGKHRIYTVFSLWDTYRALHPLLTLIDRQRTEDFIYTFSKHYEQGGELTMWELSSHETHCMIGYHSAPVILEAFNAGILDSFSDDFKREMLQAMVATSNRNEGMLQYAAEGYLSSEKDNESVSKTLEYSFDDWCIAQYAAKISKLSPATSTQPSTTSPKQAMATSIDSGSSAISVPLTGNISSPKVSLSPAEAYKIYMRRSQSWKNILDPNGYMHARRNGGFISPFSPSEVNNHFTEANSWQYSTYVPQDINGYFQMMGGNARMEMFLDSLFHTSASLQGRDQADITGLIGQYAHGNEPSHHTAYLYALLGKQYKTAELVRQICLNLYTSKPDGLCGNEDCGQMSAWYVLSALGFYPICPGSDTYVLGSPLFSKTTIRLENGEHITINSRNQSHKNCYILSATINNVPINNSLINTATFRHGCTMNFEMGSEPNKQFGATIASSEGQKALTAVPDAEIIVPMPYFSRWEQRFNDSITVAIKVHPGLPDARIYYSTNGSLPDTTATLYTTPIIVREDCTLRAVTYDPHTNRYSAPTTQHLTRFVADKKLAYITPPDQQYRDSGEEGLIDRLFGTENYRIGGWQGWTGNAQMMIDLLEEKTIHTIGVNCLSDCRSWVFFPQAIEVSVSTDGTNYHPFNTKSQLAATAMADPNWNYREDARQATFTVSGNPCAARYVRIKVVNDGKLPNWHVSPGEPAWLFIDEIEIN